MTKHTAAAPSDVNSPLIPASIAAAVSAAATRAGIAYRSERSTDGISCTRVSRIVPPPTAVTAPSRIAGATCRPYSSALAVPMTANTLSPTASRTTIGVSSRASSLLATNAISAPPAASAR